MGGWCLAEIVAALERRVHLGCMILALNAGDAECMLLDRCRGARPYVRMLLFQRGKGQTGQTARLAKSNEEPVEK